MFLLVPAHPGSPGQKAVKRLCVCVCVCVCVSVRPILRIGEYSLVALQHRRIRYIGLRVSADADTPAAITINSNQTRRLKHMARVDRI